MDWASWFCVLPCLACGCQSYLHALAVPSSLADSCIPDTKKRKKGKKTGKCLFTHSVGRRASFGIKCDRFLLRTSELELIIWVMGQQIFSAKAIFWVRCDVGVIASVLFPLDLIKYLHQSHFLSPIHTVQNISQGLVPTTLCRSSPLNNHNQDNSPTDFIWFNSKHLLLLQKAQVHFSASHRNLQSSHLYL